MYNIIWWGSLVIAFIGLVNGVIISFYSKGDFGKIAGLSYTVCTTFAICLLIENKRISRLEDYLKKIELKSITNKESSFIKRELDILRWALVFIATFVVLIITYLLNRKTS